jgi:hypothetical protein
VIGDCTLAVHPQLAVVEVAVVDKDGGVDGRRDADSKEEQQNDNDRSRASCLRLTGPARRPISSGILGARSGAKRQLVTRDPRPIGTSVLSAGPRS